MFVACFFFISHMYSVYSVMMSADCWQIALLPNKDLHFMLLQTLELASRVACRMVTHFFKDRVAPALVLFLQTVPHNKGFAFFLRATDFDKFPSCCRRRMTQYPGAVVKRPARNITCRAFWSSSSFFLNKNILVTSLQILFFSLEPVPWSNSDSSVSCHVRDYTTIPPKGTPHPRV